MDDKRKCTLTASSEIKDIRKWALRERSIMRNKYIKPSVINVFNHNKTRMGRFSIYVPENMNKYAFDGRFPSGEQNFKDIEQNIKEAISSKKYDRDIVGAVVTDDRDFLRGNPLGRAWHIFPIFEGDKLIDKESFSLKYKKTYRFFEMLRKSFKRG